MIVLLDHQNLFIISIKKQPLLRQLKWGVFTLEMQTEKQKVDMFLLLTIVILLMIGIVMVYRSSHIWADYKYNDTFLFIKKQILFDTLVIVASVVMKTISYLPWKL